MKLRAYILPLVLAVIFIVSAISHVAGQESPSLWLPVVQNGEGPTPVIPTSPPPSATSTATLDVEPVPFTPTPTVTTNGSIPPTATPTHTATQAPTNTSTTTPTSTPTHTTTATATSTGTSTPTVTPTPLVITGNVLIGNSSAFEPFSGSGGLYVVGQVLNNTNVNVAFVEFEVVLRDFSGNVIASQTGFASVPALAPGWTSPFIYIFNSVPPNWFTYTVVITDWIPVAEVEDGLQQFNVSSYFGSSDSFHVDGEILNQTSETRNSVKVYVTMLDVNGDVIGTWNELANPSTLAPGQTATFDVGIPFWAGRPNGSLINSYVVTIH